MFRLENLFIAYLYFLTYLLTASPYFFFDSEKYLESILKIVFLLNFYSMYNMEIII